MTAALRRLWHLPDAWLARPDGLTGRGLGLFRIIYGLFALWYWSQLDSAFAQPPAIDNTLWGLEIVPPPSDEMAQVLESVLAGALVLLTAGLWTRPATFVTLVVGGYLAALWSRVDSEHGFAVTVIFIPAVMLVLDGWGDHFSVDALRRTGPVERGDPSRWSVGPKVLLLMVGVLFVSAGLWKTAAGTWWSNADEVTVIVQKADLKAAINDVPSNPFSALMVTSPVSQGMRVLVPVSEVLFLVALVGPLARRTVVSIAIVFHGLNALLLAVTFTVLVVVYAAWVDWAWFLDRLPRSAWRPPPRSAFLTAAVIAVVIGVGWNQVPAVREVWTLWGAFDQRTIWYVLTPLGLVGLASVPVTLIERRRRASPGRVDAPA